MGCGGGCERGAVESPFRAASGAYVGVYQGEIAKIFKTKIRNFHMENNRKD